MTTIKVKARDLAGGKAGPFEVPTGSTHKIVIERDELVVVSVKDVNFPSGGSVLLPAPRREVVRGESKRVPSSLRALGVALAFAEQNPGRKLLVAGHADTIGGAVANEALSLRRARSVHLYLAGRHADWASHAHENHRPADLQLLLLWLANQFGYDCATTADGRMGPKTRRALERYRRAARAAGMSPGQEKDPPSVADWETFARHYDHVLAGAQKVEVPQLTALREKLSFTSPEAFGFGEQFPADGGESERESEVNRRVELLFFPSDAVPPLTSVKTAGRAYSNLLYRRRHLPVDPEHDILLRLVTIDGAPVPDQAYVVTFADGSRREGRLGKSGTALIEDPPEGAFQVEYPEHDAIREKAMAGRIREALEQGDLDLIAGVLSQPADVVGRVAKAYEEGFNDLTGKGVVKDVQVVADGTQHEKVIDHLLVEAGLVKRPRPKPRPRPAPDPAATAAPEAAAAPTPAKDAAREPQEPYRIVAVPSRRVVTVHALAADPVSARAGGTG